MTKEQILRYFPKAKKSAVREVWEDSDGIWIILHEGWNADYMDSDCRTIHCGGEDESFVDTVRELRYQIEGIRRL